MQRVIWGRIYEHATLMITLRHTHHIFIFGRSIYIYLSIIKWDGRRLLAGISAGATVGPTKENGETNAGAKFKENR